MAKQGFVSGGWLVTFAVLGAGVAAMHVGCSSDDTPNPTATTDSGVGDAAGGDVGGGDALTTDVLWEMLGDAGAPVDARMAAARLLQRRYGEAEQALVRVVEDRDVRVRVEAALEEHDEAEEHLERLGPLFRAR